MHSCCGHTWLWLQFVLKLSSVVMKSIWSAATVPVSQVSAVSADPQSACLPASAAMNTAANAGCTCHCFRKGGTDCESWCCLRQDRGGPQRFMFHYFALQTTKSVATTMILMYKVAQM